VLVIAGSNRWGISAADFQRLADDAKTNCIVSRALSALPMTLNAPLVGAS
jgi:osmotically inducible protein OsmC